MLSLLLASTLAFAGGKATASSVKEESDGKRVAELAFDGLLASGWAEGEVGYGEGSWLELDLGAPTSLESVSIWPGNLADGAQSYREYSRPRLIRLVLDGKPIGDPIRLQDQMQRKDIAVDATARTVRVEVIEVFEGGVYADLYIAEMAVNFTEGERARAVEKVDAWRMSKEGQKLQAAFEEQVLAAYDAHKADSDDLESLKFLQSAAGDGPEYLRKKVGALVPIGYRAAAIVPDPKAMDAIRKLKDPNGIPGLEMAALREIGRKQKEILEVVEIFYAYAELIGGGRKNIDPWGESGWEVGAIRSFEEPIAVEVDAYGQVWIADTGNNRIQRFTPDGVSDRQWGAKADVTNRWFSGTRKWYVGGSAAGEKQGEFVNPLDIELLPGKEENGFVVLDALGRIQVFDAEGRPTIGWTMRVDSPAEARVGGEGYLAWIPRKKELVAIIGKQAAVYTLDSEEVARWTVEDGTPNAVEVGKDGRLYMVFGKSVVSYSPSGYRYQEVMDETLFGEGFEDMDLTRDEEGRLWALTDTGWLFKLKKPGKLDWKVRVSEVELVRPRVAVIQGLAFVTDRDRILRVDALQMHLDELQAEENEARKQAIEAAASEGGG